MVEARVGWMGLEWKIGVKVVSEDILEAKGCSWGLGVR